MRGSVSVKVHRCIFGLAARIEYRIIQRRPPPDLPEGVGLRCSAAFYEADEYQRKNLMEWIICANFNHQVIKILSYSPYYCFFSNFLYVSIAIKIELLYNRHGNDIQRLAKSKIFERAPFI